MANTEDWQAGEKVEGKKEASKHRGEWNVVSGPLAIRDVSILGPAFLF